MSDQLRNTENDHKPNNRQSEEAPPDGGWGWAVVFSAFIACLLVNGVSHTFGILLPELLEHFKSDIRQTSWVGSVFNGTYLGIGPVAMGFVTLFGCRKVAITGAVIASAALFLSTYSPNVPTMIVLYGLLGGIGFGFMHNPSVVMVSFYFSKKRALATGIATCGTGIGTFVFAALTEKLLPEYRWKGVMWIISAIVLNGVVTCSLLRPLQTLSKFLRPQKNNREKSLESNTGDKYQLDIGRSKVPNDDKNSKENTPATVNSLSKETSSTKNVETSRSVYEQYSNEGYNKTHFLFKKTFDSMRLMFDFSLLRSPTFVIYGISCFLCIIGFFIPFTYLPDLAIGFGFSSCESVWLISIIGIFNTAARVVVGYISDRKWVDCLLINSCALVVGGVATLFAPFYSIYGVLALYSGIFGISIAVFVLLRSIIIVELLSLERLANSFGLLTMFQGLSAFIGSPIAGALTDVTGDYKAAFYFSGASMALAGLICFPLRRISAWENKERCNMKSKRKDIGMNEMNQDSNNTLHTVIDLEISLNQLERGV